LSAGLGVLDNYIVTNAGAEFTINKRLATWTTNSASKTYGDPDPGPLTTGSGLTDWIVRDRSLIARSTANRRVLVVVRWTSL